MTRIPRWGPCPVDHGRWAEPEAAVSGTPTRTRFGAAIEVVDDVIGPAARTRDLRGKPGTEIQPPGERRVVRQGSSTTGTPGGAIRSAGSRT
jgi:hypothetical protein